MINEFGDSSGLRVCRLDTISLQTDPTQRQICKLDHESANLAELADWSTESADQTISQTRANIFVLLERGRDGGCWSWVVFECPCISVVSGSFLMNKQHKRYTQSTPSHSLMLAVLLASPASSALVCTKLRSKAQDRSHQCASQLRWETR